MKRIITVFLSLTLLFTTSFLSCSHEHDECCGYNPTTQEGCTHEHDASCFIEPYNGLEPDGGDN